MVKKVISIATVFLMLCCMIPFGAFADDILDVCPKCGERTYETWTDFSTTVPELGFPLSGKYRHCTSCGYTYYDWNCLGFAGYKDFDNGGEGFFLDYIKNWCTKTFGQNATATKAPSGIGRKDLPGYNNYDTGSPAINPDGTYRGDFAMIYDGFQTPFGTSTTQFIVNAKSNFTNGSYTTSGDGEISSYAYYDSAGNVTKVAFARTLYYFQAPATGYYDITIPSVSVSASQKSYDGSSSDKADLDFRVYLDFTSASSLYYSEIPTSSSSWDYWNSSYIKAPYVSKTYSRTFYVTKGNYIRCVYYVSHEKDMNSSSRVWQSITLQTSAPTIVCRAYEDTSGNKLSNQTNITINKNTWNGNIYTDNSTNLTYIYPQYTTINENNETVTNISNNPIIYNNETKQYYTYDSVTNNYYYITYEQPPATPTPSPSPLPSPTPTETSSPSESPAPTPTPDSGENPTPTPTPGGGTIITPGGDGSGSGSGSSSGITGGDDEGLFGWLWDLLKDLVKAILKAIFKVLSGLLGFLIWLVERVGILLPFLPAPAIAALGAGVVLVFVIRIIRFIRG